ncbi:hypothetical protein GW17_00044502 [Ensete ventricosum]|nr:hypothetical protein GW17_00044502 [Ensete ventricosum]
MWLSRQGTSTQTPVGIRDASTVAFPVWLASPDTPWLAFKAPTGAVVNDCVSLMNNKGTWKTRDKFNGRRGVRFGLSTLLLALSPPIGVPLLGNRDGESRCKAAKEWQRGNRTTTWRPPPISDQCIQRNLHRRWA